MVQGTEQSAEKMPQQSKWSHGLLTPKLDPEDEILVSGFKLTDAAISRCSESKENTANQQQEPVLRTCRKANVSKNSIKPGRPIKSRRTEHSVIERRRRDKMNVAFQTLKGMVSSCKDQEMQKLAILEATIEHMRYLEAHAQPGNPPKKEEAGEALLLLSGRSLSVRDLLN